jgi:hypothetical protein
MIRGHVDTSLGAYVRGLDELLPGELEAVYAVGGLALDDFSPRQSNVDLVVVTTDGFDPAGVGGREPARRLAGAERHLERVGRPPSIWYTTWEEVASHPPAGTADGSAEVRPHSRSLRWSGPRIDTPMTRALLREDAIAIAGPDWPVVWYDERVLRQWCRRRLHALFGAEKGLLILRRVVSPMVLEASRLAMGSLTGKVLSKSAAGEAVRAVVPPHFRRILTDSVGYRQGAQTSMYWGPFERKYDALRLLERLEETIPEP